MTNQLWQECLYMLEEKIPAREFTTWIRPLEARFDTDTLTLTAPNRFVEDWVTNKYLNDIEYIARQYGGKDIRVVINNRLVSQSIVVNNTTDLSNTLLAGLPAGSVSRRGPATSQVLQTNLIDEHVRVGEKVSASDVQAEIHSAPNIIDDGIPNFDEVNSVSQRAKSNNTSGNADSGQGHADPDGFLNPVYTFQNFVKGDSNEEAHVAAYAVAEDPGQKYNPLFIWGASGLGKTHLMHAVGHRIKQKNPDARVVYLSAESFVQDYVNSIRNNKIEDFKRYYRSLDALLIDDIHFFANKTKSQEEFFYTFNALLEGQQQVVMTSDRMQKDIDKLEDRLISRFSWGLTVQIEPPDLETRAAILRKKADEEGFKLSNETALYVAQLVRSNVRELEGALKRLTVNSRHITGREINVDLARTVLRDLVDLQNRQVSIDNIQKTVASYYKIKVADLSSKRRNRSIARPRQVAMALAKELTSHSLPDIGEQFGGRDHTTVIHAVKKIAELREITTDVREDYDNLLRTLTT